MYVTTTPFLPQRALRPASPPPASPCPGPGLADLPVELLRMIDLQLPDPDHRNFSLSCKRLHRAVQDPVTLQLRESAAVAGLAAQLRAVSAPHAGVPVVIGAVDFMAGHWRLLMRRTATRPDLALLMARTVGRGWTLAGSDLAGSPAAVEATQRLVRALRSLSDTLERPADNARMLGLQMLAGGLSWQLFLGARPDRRGAMHDTLCALLPTRHGDPGAAGHVESLARMIRFVPPADRPRRVAAVHALLQGWPEPAAGAILAVLPPRPSADRACSIL